MSGHLCLLIGLTQRRSELSSVFGTAGTFIAQHPQQLGPYLPRDLEIGMLFSLMILFQRDSSQFLNCKTARRLGEDSHVKGPDMEFVITSFLK